MSGRDVAFEVNTKELELFAKALLDGCEAMLNGAEKALKRGGEEWRRRVVRVTPRTERGTAAQRWVLTFDRDKYSMSVTLSNPIDYVRYLEFGTDRIAKGRVKAWKEGDPPIMDWPAKHADIPNMTLSMPGSKKYERHADIITNAFTSGQGEQMPMLRPIGWELAPKIVEDVKQALVEEFIGQLVKSGAKQGFVWRRMF